MKKISILYQPTQNKSSAIVRELEKFLTGKNILVWHCSPLEADKAQSEMKDTDLLLSVGSDDAVLRSVQILLPHHIPVTGISLETPGFLTELSANEALDRLPALLAGDGWTDERTMLTTTLSNDADKAERTFHALNDVVIARGSVPRMIYVETAVNGERLTTYHVDGVIMATATGSTGYALTASGAILSPQSRNFLLVPLLAHLSPGYTLVLPETATVTMTIHTDGEVALTVDSHISTMLADGVTVTLKRSPHTVRFLRIHPDAYYSSLESKLKGKC